MPLCGQCGVMWAGYAVSDERKDCPDCTIAALQAKVAELSIENDALREDLIGALEEYLLDRGFRETEGKLEGWIDSMACSGVRSAGDYLVKLGVYERHPEGHGRRWWYRKIKKGGE